MLVGASYDVCLFGGVEFQNRGAIVEVECRQIDIIASGICHNVEIVSAVAQVGV